MPNIKYKILNSTIHIITYRSTPYTSSKKKGNSTQRGREKGKRRKEKQEKKQKKRTKGGEQGNTYLCDTVHKRIRKRHNPSDYTDLHTRRQVNGGIGDPKKQDKTNEKPMNRES